MNINMLNKLEFDKIKEILSTYCNTFLGRNLVSELEPSNQKNIVFNKLSETEEALNLIYKSSTPPISEISDISIYLKSLNSGRFLSLKELLEIAKILKLAQDFKNYFFNDFIIPTDYPILSCLFNNLYTNKNICDRILFCIIDEKTINDNASEKMKNIKKKQRNLEQDIHSKLAEIIHSNKFSKYVQENVITIRNDRFVIPIKEEYRNQVKGFIHDISNAGSTLFIEPFSVFELNNEINRLKLEEEIEIQNILQNLSNLITPYIDELNLNLNTIGKLDFIFAKAKYAKSTNANIPKLTDKKEIVLINAKHPLLDQTKAVPITLSLGTNFSTLLITGPNTGGKTVTLKTVGLLTCMSCCGLAIPASESSKIYVFSDIFADIGDEQSISNSLSTFSSHMSNIVYITKHANNNSLILLDELGSGTDPMEGANLAISILDTYNKLGALTIATTHYQELKKYALANSSFENASVEFNLNTLSPTYKLLIGVPGKSNAFEISKKLGLSDSIINKAKSLMHSDDIKFEEILKKIYDDKSQIEKEKDEITKNLEEVSNLKNSLEMKSISLKQKEDEIINNAKVKAREILIDAKENANSIIKEMNNSSSIKDLELYRTSLNNKIKNLNDIKNTISANNSTTTNPIPINDIHPNLDVFVTTLEKNGTIVSNISKSNEVLVQIGNIKMNINVKYLEKAKSSKNSTKSDNLSKNVTINKTKNAKSEINVIGLNVEEAIFVIDKFLDDCSLAKLSIARIIHGKGTGKLRNGIHQFLKSHPHVKSFRIGKFGEGELGVTVVELK